MSSIDTLVDNINSLDEDEIVSVIKVDKGYMIREIRDGMAPSMVMLGETEALSHLSKLYNRRIKYLENNIKVARTKVYEVWFDGSLLGLYRGNSFYEACMEAARTFGFLLDAVKQEEWGITYFGKHLFQSEAEMQRFEKRY